MANSILIPRFYLYGEPHRETGRRFLHAEHLADRSRPSEWTIRPHSHVDLNHVFHILEGGGGMRAESDTLSFKAPCLILVPAGIVHGFDWTSESRGAVVTISTDYLARLVQSDPALSSLFQTVATADLEKIESEGFARRTGELMTELAWRAPGHQAAAEAGLLDLLVRSLRAIETQDDVRRSVPGYQAALVARFRERVEARFRLREPVAAYVEALHTSQTRLRAACAAIAARSPMQIIDQRAIVEAKRALLYTNLAIGEIAENLGLPDAAYFSRFFSRRAGISPRAYRNMHLSPDFGGNSDRDRSIGDVHRSDPRRTS